MIFEIWKAIFAFKTDKKVFLIFFLNFELFFKIDFTVLKYLNSSILKLKKKSNKDLKLRKKFETEKLVRTFEIGTL